MDRFTRNHTIFLAMIGLLLLAWMLYKAPQISALNELLEQDAEVASYPYQFRVMHLKMVP